MKILIATLITLTSLSSIASPQIYKICQSDSVKIGLYHVGEYVWIKTNTVNEELALPENHELARELIHRDLFTWSSERDFILIDLKKNSGIVKFNGKRQRVSCVLGGHQDMWD